MNENMLEVYRIPFNYLYYNDENGRIASAINREDEKLNVATEDENPKYNTTIAKMIVEDNQPKMKTTKNSIKSRGQQVFGYVLEDGRVIDGNRRFTALRMIAEETGESQFFEAVILPFTYESKADRAEIKRLELAIQMGTEEKQVYDPVDLSVDIYHTVILNQLMTKADYARETNMKLKAISDRINAVEWMRDFLHFINAPKNAYYIIKDTKLYNPLYELAKKIEKQFTKGEPRYEQTKITSFAQLSKMVHTGGDTVREVRDYLKDVVITSSNDGFNDDLEETIDDLRDRFDEEPITSAAQFTKVLERATSEIREISSEYNQTVNRNNRGRNVESFIGDVNEALNTLIDMEKGDGLIGNLNWNNFSNDQLNEIRDFLIKINVTSKELIEIYEEEL